MRGDTPQSRRDRPAKPPLSREWIVDAAVQILQSEGLEHVTMRRVAQALDTGAASLYVYVANTAHLHAEMLDRLLSGLQMPAVQLPAVRGPQGQGPASGHWTEQVLTFLEGYSAVLTTYPGLARSALTMRPDGVHYLRVHEITAELLAASGLPIASALWGADLLILLVTASAAEHTTPPEPAAAPITAAPATTARPPLTFTEAHPLLSAHADLVFGGTPRQRQRWQLQTIIAGLYHLPVPTLEEKTS